MAFYLKAEDFSSERRERDRTPAPKPETPPPAHLNDFSPEEWAIVQMARKACLEAGDLTAIPGESPLAAHVRDTAAFDARNPSPTPRRRARVP